MKAEQNNQCAICGNVGHLTIHHKIPIIQGGGKERSNAVGLCRHSDGCGCHTIVDFLTIQKHIPYEQIMRQGITYYLDQYPGIPGRKRKKFNKGR